MRNIELEMPRRAKMSAANLAGHLQRFFTDRLLGQMGASSHTVASYRDTFRLLLVFASKRLKRAPSKLRVQDLDTTLLGAFLLDLEHTRANTTKRSPSAEATSPPPKAVASGMRL